MNITSQMVKDLRDKTAAGMMDCKKALTETDGDMEKAVDLLRLKGLAVAAKRAGRATSEGVIETYIHAGGKLGVMVELGCETDFVAKTDTFSEFARDIAMHIAAANPVAITREEVPEEVLFGKRKSTSSRPSNPANRQILRKKWSSERLKNSWRRSVCLSRNTSRIPISIQDLLNEIVGKMGENITIKRFARFQVGVE